MLKSIPIFIGVISISFLLVYIAPGDPAISMVGENYKEETLQEIREELNLNKPIIKQYYLYILKTIKLDFGKSYITGRKISKDLKQFDKIIGEIRSKFSKIIKECNYSSVIEEYKSGELIDSIRDITLLSKKLKNKK